MDIVIVTAGIIIRNSKILIAQRKANGNQGLKWEFPGGKLEENESPEQGLKREIKEELNIDIDVIDIVDVIYHKYEELTILLLCYSAKYVSGDIKAIECNDYRWVDIEELERFYFADADMPIVKKLVKKGLPL